MKRPFLAMVLIFCLELFTIVVFLPGNFASRLVLSETSMIQSHMGDRTLVWVTNQADSWYQDILIDSGAYDAVRDLFIPTETERARSGVMQDVGSPWFSWLDSRLETVGILLYQVMIRVAILKMWAPFVLILLVPAAYDGYMIWRVKRTGFDYASPLLKHYSLNSIFILSIGLLVAFCLPFPLEPYIIPFVMMLSSLLIGVAISNTAKRI